jgi:hypothetical protein
MHWHTFDGLLLGNRETALCHIEFMLQEIVNLVHVPDLPPDPVWSDEGFVVSVLETLPAIVLKHITKAKRTLWYNCPCVRSFRFMCEGCTGKVVETKLIQLASVMLIAHINAPEIMFHDFQFLCTCAAHGFLLRLREIGTVFPNGMKVLNTQGMRQTIVDRCVGLAFEIGHPRRFTQWWQDHGPLRIP